MSSWRNKERKRSSNEALTPADLRKLLISITDKRDYSIIELGYEGALRVGEMASLTPERINYNTSRIRVWDQKKDAKITIIDKQNNIKERRERPNLKWRNEYIPPETLKRFKLVEREALGLSMRTYERIIQKYSMRGLQRPLSWHVLRHTWITLSLNAGRSIKFVCMHTGDTEATIAKVYHNLSPEQLEKEREIKTY